MRQVNRRRGIGPALVCAAAVLVSTLAACDGDDTPDRPALGRCGASPAGASATPAAGHRGRPLNRDDFDGDGRHDLLLPGPHGAPGGLLLGSAHGVSAARRVPLSGRVPGLDDRWSAMPPAGLAFRPLTGDWDGDGRADILYTRSETPPDDRPSRYQAQFVWGGEGGVSGSRAVPGWTRTPFVASGDFDGDGVADLVSGAYRASRDRNNPVRCVAIDFGPVRRDGRARERRYVDITRRGSVYTDTFTAGDFDGDGRDEFVTTGFRHVGKDIPDESYPDFYVDASYYRVGRDRSVVRAGGLEALDAGRNTHYDPDSGGDPDPVTAPADILTTRLTADFGGNGRVDLSDGKHVFYGGASGPGTGRAPTELVLGDTDAVGDVDGDGRDDLVIADYRDAARDQVGDVAVFLGGRNGLAPQAAYTFDRTDLGIPGRPANAHDRDFFGDGLALADLDGDGCAELALHMEDFKSRGRKSAYWLIPGSPHGPVLTRAERLDPGRPGRG